MRVFRQAFCAVLLCAVLVFAALSSSTAAAFGESDQTAAERILGPQWKRLSQRAGMVFAGTVLGDGAQTAKVDLGVPSVALRFRVDRAIAGVEPGQVLTIREWTGAQALHPPMRRGERFLLFLYVPSRLGLTSPVGGRQGQIQLDATGQAVAAREPATPASIQNASHQS